MPYEIDFLRAGTGNGDAICLRYGSPQTGYTIHVVDGGFVDTGERLARHIWDHYGQPDTIHHVVVTHADNDHAAGLIKLFEYYKVEHLWMNRPWRFLDEVAHNFHGNFRAAGLATAMRVEHKYVVELEKAATSNGTAIHDVFQGDVIGNFVVMAPSRPRYFNILPDFDKTPTRYATAESLAKARSSILSALEGGIEFWGFETLEENPSPPTSASNESSVVQLGIFGDDLVLLTGDAGPIALHEARDYYQLRGWKHVPVKVVQVPHHGSRKNSTPSALDRWLGTSLPLGSPAAGFAICSVGEAQHDYPRRAVSNAFLRRGYPVYSTQKCDLHYRNGMPKRPGTNPVMPIEFAYRFEK
jgi:hypothetical protein